MIVILKRYSIWLTGLVMLNSACNPSSFNEEDVTVGVLLSHHIDDQGWNQEAYQSVLRLQSDYDIDVYVKENISTPRMIRSTVEELVNDDQVDLIIGHSHLYEPVFLEIADDYPDVHFAGMNSELDGDNLTGLHFEGYAMGYFAGMLASEMSETNRVGVIAAFPFQPEVNGFSSGAKYHRPDVHLEIEFTESWVDEHRATAYFRMMEQNDVDIFYPAADGFHIAIVDEVKNAGLRAIGYVGDQIDLGEQVILTSTVQKVDAIYDFTFDKFKKGDLESGNLYFDFQDDAITMGEYGAGVPDEVVDWLESHIEHYRETGELPHEAYATE